MNLDVWVSPDGTEILSRDHFSAKDMNYEAGKWYSSEEICLWLKTKASKWRLDNFDRAHSRVFKDWKEDDNRE